jgi:predicted TIM-barrel fold metal-dependent hydrolase
MAVNLLCWSRLEQAAQLAAGNPNTRLVIDHLGLRQPFEPPPPHPWADLPKVLALAADPNVAIKITSAGTLSRTSRFPTRTSGIRSPTSSTHSPSTAACGAPTRAVKLLTYKEGVEAFRLTDRLSDGDRAKLMGGTASRIYGRSPSKA